MTDKTKAIAGLAVFVILVTYPFWSVLGSATAASAPELELPEGEDNCVEETQFMTANHMDLLNQWRNAVVRDGEREYISASGERHVMSLTGTCMGCHSNRDAFCTRCHDYSNVSPACWDCHVEPEGN
ncbi:MAG: hypothetical protein AMS18_05295 [Gemmatimonas sp. SG8_17]|nr:MAG: hypothetical protein AMS18_05295 [Gemmatimonas sp. SG8_17]